MKRIFIVTGFVVLVVGALVYMLVPYTTTMHYEL